MWGSSSMWLVVRANGRRGPPIAASTGIPQTTIVYPRLLVIDLHAHILPGVDDGPRTWDESLEILRTMAADGVTAVAATPHVRDDYPTSAATMEQLVGELRDRAAAAGI